MTAAVWPTTADGRWLVLRTCSTDMTSRGGFRWPESGHVEAPDWDPDPRRDCGGGLHGLLWGCGDAGLLSPAPDARWLVVAVDPADVADPDVPSKVRFRRGEVLFVGGRDEATAWIVDRGGYGLPVVYAQVTAGYGGTAITGDGGTATAGDMGTATAGYGGTATAGYRGTATAGSRGTATAGVRGTVVARWWDDAAGRHRLAVGYVGEGGIEAGVAYRATDRGQLVRAERVGR